MKVEVVGRFPDRPDDTMTRDPAQGPKPLGPDEVKTALFAGLFAGQRSLAEALTISPEALVHLRSQAHALYHAAQWDACVKAVEALHALGDVELWDPVMLSRCHQELGDHERAAICARIAEELLARATGQVASARGSVP